VNEVFEESRDPLVILAPLDLVVLSVL
jgi:hypothetical protein